MIEKVVKPYLQWEPDAEDSNEGEEHIFIKIIQAEVPFIQSDKYLCGKSFSEEPDRDAITFEQFFEPSTSRVHLLKNLCKKCLAEYEKNYPKL